MGGRNNPATKRAYYKRKKAEQGLTVRVHHWRTCDPAICRIQHKHRDCQPGCIKKHSHQFRCPPDCNKFHDHCFEGCTKTIHTHNVAGGGPEDPFRVTPNCPKRRSPDTKTGFSKKAVCQAYGMTKAELKENEEAVRRGEMAEAFLAQAVRHSPEASRTLQGLENKEEECLTHQQLLRAYKDMRAKEKDARELLQKANADANAAEAEAQRYRAQLEEYHAGFQGAGMASSADLAFALEAFGVMKNAGIQDTAELQRRLS